MKRLSAVAVLLIISAIYIPFLSRTILYDEAYTYLQYVPLPPPQIIISYTLPNNHMLYSVAVWASTQLMGGSVIAIRFPALAFGILSLAMIYRLGRQLQGHNTGLLAMLVLALNPMFARYSVESRGYSLGIFLMLSLFMLMLSPHIQGRKRNYPVLFINAALILTLPTMALASGGVAVWLIYRRRWADLAPVVIGTLMGSLFYLPTISFITDHATSFGEGPTTLVRSVQTMLIGSITAIPFLVGLVGYLYLRPRQAYLELVAGVLGTTIGLTVLQIVVTGNGTFARNYLYVVPTLAIVSAIGLEQLMKSWTAAMPLTMLILIALLFPATHDLSLKTRADHALSYIQQSREDATVVPGCCVDMQVYYHLGDDHPKLILDSSKQGVDILVDSDTLEQVITFHRLEDDVHDCQYTTEWFSLFIYTCQIEGQSIPATR